MAGVKLRILLLGLIATVIIPSAAVQAQTTTETPANRCGLAQNYLKNIQKPRDLRARVGRLQAYRYIHQRLEVFVVRLEKNGQPRAEELRTIVDEFNRLTESFKNDYEAYDKAREAAAGMRDCKTNTTEFLAKLNQARSLREKVHADVVALDTLLSPGVSNQLDTLHRTLLASDGTEATNE